MFITVATWSWAGDETDNVFMTSSWTTRSLAGYEFDTSHVNVVTQLAYTASGTASLMNYTFTNVPVIRMAQRKSGSLYQQSMTCPYPSINHASMSADNVQIRWKGVSQVELIDGPGYYVRFTDSNL